jgi:glutathione S-transferase
MDEPPADGRTGFDQRFENCEEIMSELILYGPPQSSYVRTARMTCFEKDVAHRLEPVELGSDAHKKLHPWAKVPVLRDGNVHLYETSAIVRYIDETRGGTKLTPSTPAGRALMEQWLSSINCYVYGNVVRSYALKYVLPMLRGESPNRAEIDAGIPQMQRDLAVLNEGYAKGPFLVGDELTLADLFVAPIVQTAAMFPEGEAALKANPNLTRAYEALKKRPSFESVHKGVFG